MLPLRDDHPTLRFPLIVLLVVVANIAVFVFVQPHDGGGDEVRFVYEHAAIPCELRQGQPLSEVELFGGVCLDEPGPPVFPDKNVWLAVLTSMFLHAGWLHLLGNLWFLWIFGNNVEEYATKLGFVAVYLFSGFAAMAAHYLADPASTTPVVGASGAIAGVMGMYFVLWPRARILTLTLFFFISAIYVPAVVVLGAWFVLQFFTDANSGVAWVAHVGGFLAGAGLGLLLRTVRPPRAPYELRPASPPPRDWPA